ncbi:hypothetical protein [Paenibacillus cymbidii]|uniref:hypothetical protein n=1 Tax=Paenibacillus cymbidii TaxID=1639034 RepID=UPI0010812217|nr:hypothetical protein [Paenibacillus cymbidii]
MAWERLLETEQLEVIVDDARRSVMLEVNSGSAVPKYITVHIATVRELDDVIAALQQARKRIQADAEGE